VLAPLDRNRHGKRIGRLLVNQAVYSNGQRPRLYYMYILGHALSLSLSTLSVHAPLPVSAAWFAYTWHSSKTLSVHARSWPSAAEQTSLLRPQTVVSACCKLSRSRALLPFGHGLDAHAYRGPALADWHWAHYVAIYALSTNSLRRRCAASLLPTATNATNQVAKQMCSEAPPPP